MTRQAFIVESLFVISLVLNACQSPEIIEEIRDGVIYVSNPYTGRWQGRQNPPIRLELEQIFGVENAPEQAILSGIAGVAADEAGNIYVLDWQDNRLVSFSPDGSVRWTTGRKGQGPGEFENPGGLVWDGHTKLFISNQSRSRIDLFDTDGNFLESHHLREYGLDRGGVTGFIQPNILVLRKSMTGFLGAEIALFELDETWRNKAVIRVDQSNGLKVPEGLGAHPDIEVIEENIILGNVGGEYRIAFYDQDGSLKHVVTRDMHDLVRPGFYEQGGSRSIMTFGNLSAPVRLPNGYWMTSATWPTNVDDPDDYVKRRRAGNAPELEFGKTLDLFDRRGRLLYSFTGDDAETEELEGLLFVDKSGKLYTSRSEPFPQVRRYRVKIVEDKQ